MAQLGSLIVNGAARVLNNIYGNLVGTINGFTIGKSVPSDAKFTDTVTTATTSGSGNAVTAISASNGALTVTKGTTFLTSHQDISGKVSGPSSATADHVATFSGTTGKVVKDSGYTIAKSVPSNAVFTDHITSATTSGSGNAVTAISADANGALTVTKGTTFLTSHQDISGKVSGPSSATNNAVAIFDGTGGKTIKNSGYTIGKSVPSDAVFTDTTYSSKTAASGGTDVSLVTTGEKYTWNSKTSNTGTVTKVTAGSGLSGGDITTSGTINHASTVTAGTAGTSSGTNGATLAVPYVTYNGTGHITATGTHTHTVNGLIAYCITAANYTTKVATCPGYVLTANRYVVVRMTTANTSAGALTLAINGTLAKPIYINGTAASSSNYTLPAGDYIVFYDGYEYQFRTDGFLPTPNLYGGIAYCSTGMATAAKVATCPGYGLFENRFIYVRMLLANTTTAKLTLSINGTTAKDIYINGKVSSSSNYNLPAGDYLVYYDGTGYHFWTNGAFLADQLYESDAYAITSNDINDIFS